MQNFERGNGVTLKLLKCFLCVFFLVCIIYTQEVFASSQEPLILAKVNGERIYERDLADKLRTIHANKISFPPGSKEGAANPINISDVIKTIVNERLIIQEAFRLGLDSDPYFVRRFGLFEKTQLILRLRKEQVIDKITITDQELRDYFIKWYNQKGPIDEKKFKHVQRRIERKLRKLKEQELSKKFFALLRKKANIWINRRLVDSFDPENEKAVPEEKLVARLNGKPVLFKAFVSDMKMALKNKAGLLKRIQDQSEKEKKYKRMKKDVLDRLIMYGLIEQEALKRKRFYMKNEEFVGLLNKRREAFLMDTFRARVIYPLAIPLKEELTRYYKKNIKKFKLPAKVWFSEICFSHRDEAEKILNELKQGADFEFLAALESEQEAGKKDYVWVRVNHFSPSVREEFGRLKVGDVSGIIADDSLFKIIKLNGKKEGKTIAFSNILGKLKKIVFRKKFDKLLEDYVARLRKRSDITIYKDAIARLEKRYWNELPKKNKK